MVGNCPTDSQGTSAKTPNLRTITKLRFQVKKARGLLAESMFIYK